MRLRRAYHTAGADPGLMTSINTTPLIDVMLVLLIMLIITIPIQTHAVKLNMASALTPPVPPAAVSIDIDADGTLHWDGRTLVDRAELERQLRDAAAQPVQPELRLRPDARVSYGRVAMVMAAAQRLGVTKIGLLGNEQFSR